MAVYISKKFDSFLAIVFVFLAIASFGFGVYELVNGDVTNGLLAFILGVLSLNFYLHWTEATFNENYEG